MKYCNYCSRGEDQVFLRECLSGHICAECQRSASKSLTPRAQMGVGNMLCDNEIVLARERGQLGIDPWDSRNLGPNSYDLTLAGKARVIYADNEIDLTATIPRSEVIELPAKLMPGKCAIVMSRERLNTGVNYIGLLSQRSNLARLPLVMNFSNLVDTGFTGTISASIRNIFDVPIILKPGLRFMQVMFMEVNEPSVKYLARALSKNTNQTGQDVPHFKIDKEWLQ